MKKLKYIILLLISLLTISLVNAIDCPEDTYLGDDFMCYSVSNVTVYEEPEAKVSVLSQLTQTEKNILGLLLIGFVIYYAKSKSGRKMFYE